MKLMLVTAIRPDYIRLAPLIEKLDKEPNIELILVHSGQQYHPKMYDVFLKELNIRKPDFDLEAGKDLVRKGPYDYVDLINLINRRLCDLIRKVRPSVIGYLGDTNSTVSSFIAARELVPIFRVESGMRSFDWSTPEEKNRIIADHMASFNFAYLQTNRDNLIAEGIPDYRIQTVGNTIVEVINKHAPSMSEPYKGDKYIYSTIHREENTADPIRFKDILDQLNQISERDHRVVLPLIPSAKRRAESLGDYRKIWNCIDFVEPLSFFESIKCQIEAEYVISDSGSISEETSILGTPCLIVRQSTERSEVLECGGALMEDTNGSLIDTYYYSLKDIKKKSWRHRLGDGQTSSRIVNTLKALDANDFFKDSRKMDWIASSNRIKRSMGELTFDVF